MKWELVPAEQFYELMFSLAELERNGALPYQLEGMAAAIEATPQPPKLSDERILEIWANNSGRPVTMGKARIIAQARAIEREILGENNDSN